MGEKHKADGFWTVFYQLTRVAHGQSWSLHIALYLLPYYIGKTNLQLNNVLLLLLLQTIQYKLKIFGDTLISV